MKNKFSEYYSTPEKIKEMSKYVHLNFKLIMTKMQSEMRRKLEIAPEYNNQQGYLSLMVSLHGRMFNEMIYCLAGISKSFDMRFDEIIPKETLLILLALMKGNNPIDDERLYNLDRYQDKFEDYYMKEIDALRAVVEALPK